MTRWGKRLFAIAFSFMFALIGVGYAQIVDTLVINGKGSLELDGVVVTNVVVMGGTAADKSHGHFLPTNVTSEISGTQGQSVTYKITVKNYSDKYKYAYVGIVCDTSAENNGIYGDGTEDYTGSGLTITTKNPDGTEFKKGTAIEAGQELTFLATYTIGSGAPADIKTIMNYKFGVHVDSAGAMAAERTLELFLKILNTSESYGKLTEDIDNKYSGYTGYGDPEAWRANYIGNVSANVDEGDQSETAKDDIETIKALFGEEGLTLDTGNGAVNITIMIKRENLDGDTRTGDSYKAVKDNTWGRDYTTTGTGCEMTLYMTADNLDNTKDEGEYPTEDHAKVYVAVFTCTNDGSTDANGNTKLTSKWYQIGDIYEGHTDIVSYDGDANGEGSFVTDRWVSDASTLTVTDNYSYNIAADLTISNLVRVKANVQNGGDTSSAWKELTSLNTTAVAVLNGEYGSFAGEAITNLEAAQAEAAALIAKDTQRNGGTITRVAAIPVIKSLAAALKPFESYIN